MKKQELKFSQVKFAKLKICELKKIRGGGEDGDSIDNRIGEEGNP